MAGYLNGNNPGGPDNGGDDNVIRIPTLAERDRLRKEKEKIERTLIMAREPIFNMPPVTKWLLALLIGLFILTELILPDEYAASVIEKFGFIPASMSGENFTPLALLTPFTHMFLHGSWMHIAMNGLMLAAFGSGIERWLGSRRMMILFLLSGLLGAGAHYILNTNSIYPMIGASGGLSGLFAGAMIMLNRGQREMGGRFGMLPFVLLWIGISIGFGMMGGPDGSVTAWAAHVGGFLGGFAVLKIMRV